MRFFSLLTLVVLLTSTALAEQPATAPAAKVPPPLLTSPAPTTPAGPPAWLPTPQATLPKAMIVPAAETPQQAGAPILAPSPKQAAGNVSGGETEKVEKKTTKKQHNGKNNARIAHPPEKSSPPAEEKSPENGGEEADSSIKIESVLTRELDSQDRAQKAGDTLEMLLSLVELQKSLKQQINIITKKINNSSSESEKQSLQEELGRLDKQLNETGVDFERLATGVDSGVFSQQKDVSFSWKDELSTLLEPSIKELKQLTAKARQKSELKENIAAFQKQADTAQAAVTHLNQLIDQAKDNKIKSYLNELLPAWQNMEKRINGKLDLNRRQLAQLEASDVSLLESSGRSVKEFFRDRGLFLLIAFGAFAGILLGFRLFARLLMIVLPGARKEQRPAHIRFMDIFFKFFSVIAAVCGLIAVLYLAEDWFLLSVAIILLLGLVWTVRLGLPKMWQQVRLMLNMGSIREGERLIYENVPWRVESINVFCKLYNPAMGRYLRIPIENMIGLISRPFEHDEPWFPCQKGDWVAIEGKANAKVVSLSHEQVEVVELGGRKTVYQTADFLALSPANLSTNFFIRVPFGLSYDMQKEITTTVLEKLQTFIQKKFEENGFAEDCLSLSVDFLQAGASSLDVVVFANMTGDQAPAFNKLERAISRWCVDCCNENNWEIPFPQLTVHLPGNNS